MKYQCAFSFYGNNECRYFLVIEAPNETLLRESCEAYAKKFQVTFEYYEVM